MQRPGVGRLILLFFHRVVPVESLFMFSARFTGLRIAEISRRIGEILSVVRRQKPVRIETRRAFCLLYLSILNFGIIQNRPTPRLLRHSSRAGGRTAISGPTSEVEDRCGRNQSPLPILIGWRPAWLFSISVCRSLIGSVLSALCSALSASISFCCIISIMSKSSCLGDRAARCD
jgi:hypothetical protein